MPGFRQNVSDIFQLNDGKDFCVSQSHKCPFQLAGFVSASGVQLLLYVILQNNSSITYKGNLIPLINSLCLEILSISQILF